MDIGIQMESSIGKLARKIVVVTGVQRDRSGDRPRVAYGVPAGERR
jgi:hypothetical protein